ncbi:hypothetical protein BJX62DRAFT_13979 [Aspergillus germanicus]
MDSDAREEQESIYKWELTSRTCGQGRLAGDAKLSYADARLLARSQWSGRSSRVGQVWRGSTSVSLMRGGGVLGRAPGPELELAEHGRAQQTNTKQLCGNK